MIEQSKITRKLILFDLIVEQAFSRVFRVVNCVMVSEAAVPTEDTEIEDIYIAQDGDLETNETGSVSCRIYNFIFSCIVLILEIYYMNHLETACSYMSSLTRSTP